MSAKKVVDLQPACKPGLDGVWVETVGAGNSIAAVERLRAGKDRCEYRYSLARLERTGKRRFSLDFRAEDVLDLPKLTQVLAATLVADGWLSTELKDDLSCLADCLDWFLGLREPARGTQWVVVKRESLQKVLDHLWHTEIGNFRRLSWEERKDHVFHAVVELNGLLHGTARVAEECLDGVRSDAQTQPQG